MDMKRMEAEMHLLLGRVNGLHAAIAVIARSLPSGTASVAAEQLALASKRVHSDALAEPVPDSMIEEMRRVMDEMSRVLREAARGR
jgi:hypothetical protein